MVNEERRITPDEERQLRDMIAAKRLCGVWRAAKRQHRLNRWADLTLDAYRAIRAQVEVAPAAPLPRQEPYCLTSGFVEIPFALATARTPRAVQFVFRDGVYSRWIPQSQLDREWAVGERGVAQISAWLYERLETELRRLATRRDPPVGWCVRCSCKLASPAMTECCGSCHDRIVKAAERAAKIVTLASVKDGGPLGSTPRRTQPRRNRLEILDAMRERKLSVVSGVGG